MATRRIARGRGASPVPIIVLSVLLVGLLASTIVLALQIGKVEVEVEKAKAEVVKAAEVRRADVDQAAKYARIVGLKYDAARDSLERLKRDIEAKAPIKKLDTGEEVKATGPFEDLATILNAYVDRAAVLESNETYLKDQLDKSKTERARLEKEVKAKEEEGQKLLADEKTRGDGLDAAKAKVETELAEVRKELATQIEAAKNEKVDLSKDLSATKKEVDILRKKLKEKEQQLKNIETAKNIRPLIPEATGPGANGRIVSVDADGQHVMIDVGRKEWAEVGMKFAVFDQADPDVRKQKGEVQVRRVFDVISQAKVLKQDPLDPILPGMALVNPAFSRGKTLEFVFAGKLRDPNLERALSRYPCKIAKKVTRTTDYLILGEADRRGSEPNPEDSEDYKEATGKYKNTCVVMKERELARYLGESE